MPDIGNLLCGQALEEGRAKAALDQLSLSINSFAGRSVKILKEDISDDGLASPEPAEFHIAGQAFSGIKLPMLADEHGLAILEKSVSVLSKSAAYPYGLTENLIDRLKAAGIETVGQLASAEDRVLDRIDYIGEATIKRIRDVVFQAIWM